MCRPISKTNVQADWSELCNTIRGRVQLLSKTLMYSVLPSRFIPLFCMWTRPWEDIAVAIPPIPSGSSGHRQQPGTNRSRIWTQRPAVIQACQWHRSIHGLDRWCLRWVITWTLTPTRRVSATNCALQPAWLRLDAERDCETGHFYYLFSMACRPLPYMGGG